ncbi:MAG TPA: hypothetical protein VIJ12_01625 [Candidatus Baltobacteraceae bacterium]
MAYVEWLRVRNTLRAYAIVLLVLFAGALVVRVAVNSEMRGNDWESQANVAGAHIVTSKLPDGSEQTVIDTPKNGGTHVIIREDGRGGKTVSVTERGSARSGVRSMHGSFTTGNAQHELPVDLGYLLAFAAFPALIFATILGAPLSRERENHLEVVLSKPVSRASYALEVVLVDIAAIIGSIILSTIFMLASVVIFVLPTFYISDNTWWLFGLALAAPICWYAMYLGLTTWMKRGRGIVIGIAWPVAMIVPGLSLLGRGSTNGMVQVFHAVVSGLAAIDPLTYFQVTGASGHIAMQSSLNLGGLLSLPLPTRLGIIVVLALAYFAAGFIEWQQVEA